jgi:PPOX class probable F420-dependent enzyme
MVLLHIADQLSEGLLRRSRRAGKSSIEGESMIPEAYRDLLASTALAHIATLGARGEPQSTPVWIGWDGQHIRFSQTKRQQTYRNLQRDPRVALSIVDPRNPYRYLGVRGIAVAFEDDPDRAFIDRTYAVGAPTGGLEGLQPSKNFCFSACTSGFAARTGGKERIEASPLPNPHHVSRVNNGTYAVRAVFS